MNFTQFSEKILEKCPELLNWAWKPVQSDEDTSVMSTRSKFGGVDPFRSKNFHWPSCSECSEQKTFICQIHIKNLPEKLKEYIQRKTGLFQFFFCLRCRPSGHFEDIFFISEEELIPSLQSLASRYIFLNNISTDALPEKLKSVVIKYNEVFQRSEWEEEFEERNITEWVELKREVPGYEELTVYEDFSEHAILTKTGISKDDLLDMDHEEDIEAGNAPIQFPASNIKLGGYVRWCQGVRYPTCPDCRVQMTITFLQMEADDIFPYLWGDCGTAHVTLCPQCGRPGLGWACC